MTISFYRGPPLIRRRTMRFISASRIRRRMPTRQSRPPPSHLSLERLEYRCLPSFGLGALVQAAPTDLFAACKPGNQMGTFFPDTQVEPRLAVDPTNPSHMVAAWQQERWDNGGSFGIVS